MFPTSIIWPPGTEPFRSRSRCSGRPGRRQRRERRPGLALRGTGVAGTFRLGGKPARRPIWRQQRKGQTGSRRRWSRAERLRVAVAARRPEPPCRRLKPTSSSSPCDRRRDGGCSRPGIVLERVRRGRAAGRLGGSARTRIGIGAGIGTGPRIDPRTRTRSGLSLRTPIRSRAQTLARAGRAGGPCRASGRECRSSTGQQGWRGGRSEGRGIQDGFQGSLEQSRSRPRAGSGASRQRIGRDRGRHLRGSAAATRGPGGSHRFRRPRGRALPGAASSRSAWCGTWQGWKARRRTGRRRAYGRRRCDSSSSRGLGRSRSTGWLSQHVPGSRTRKQRGFDRGSTGRRPRAGRKLRASRIRTGRELQRTGIRRHGKRRGRQCLRLEASPDSGRAAGSSPDSGLAAGSSPDSGLAAGSSPGSAPATPRQPSGPAGDLPAGSGSAAGLTASGSASSSSSSSANPRAASPPPGGIGFEPGFDAGRHRDRGQRRVRSRLRSR